jgi:hypothetical protein
MKFAITIAATMLATPALAQNATVPADAAMAAEQGSVPRDTTAPALTGPTAPGTPVDQSSDRSQSRNPPPAPVPPQVVSAADGPGASRPNKYPACTRKVKDNCANPGAK